MTFRIVASDSFHLLRIGVKCEHVLPREKMLQHLFSGAFYSAEAAANFLWENSFVCVITKDENQRLNEANLAKEGFPDDPWTRYSAGHLREPILVPDAESPPETPLLSESERATLRE